MPTVPGYRILSRIGRGGFSFVYRAEQVSLGREVAIKILLADLGDSAEERRFTNECAILGKLGAHRHVVDVHDAGITEDGRPYIVMKFYGRGTLADRVKADGSLPAAEVASIGVKMATALQAAHRIGVIHRDIKPENILVDDDGEPVLTDFGVAAVADASGGFTSSVAFSRAHVAPEVLDRNEFGVKSDIYSLGSTLYTLVTARAAFAADTEARQIVAILNDPPPPISEGGIPSGLVDVIFRAMSKNPRDRFSSAEELGNALAHIRDGAAGSQAQRATLVDPTVPDSPQVSEPRPDDDLGATRRRPTVRDEPADTTYLAPSPAPVPAETELTRRRPTVRDEPADTTYLAPSPAPVLDATEVTRRRVPPTVEPEEVAPVSAPRRKRTGLVVAVAVAIVLVAGAVSAVLLRPAGSEAVAEAPTAAASVAASQQALPASPRATPKSSSTGATALVAVPNLVGRSSSSAVAILDSLGLGAQKIAIEDGEAIDGSVVAQSPQPGSRITAGDQVTITYATAPQPQYAVKVNYASRAIPDKTFADNSLDWVLDVCLTDSSLLKAATRKDVKMYRKQAGKWVDQDSTVRTGRGGRCAKDQVHLTMTQEAPQPSAKAIGAGWSNCYDYRAVIPETPNFRQTNIDACVRTRA